jgi:NAD(P)H-dependent flavin oxidoreductase YrpB (nitropropane dioxygenase family)
VARSPLRTPLCDWFGLDVPIFGFAMRHPVAAEISRAGGLGVYGATRRTPEEIRAELADLRQRAGERAVGVNLVLPSGMPAENDPSAIDRELPETHKAFVRGLYEKYRVPAPVQRGMRSRFLRSDEMAQAQMEAVLASDVELIACGIGAPPAFVERAKRTGRRVLALCGAPKHAERALLAGADILVAQGYDAGAHTGPIGTFSLVPQIVDIAGEVPVLAAGGVATGRHIAAALALGAQGVWVGTAWLASPEYALHPIHVKKIVGAGSGDTIVSRSESGKPFRMIRSAWSEEWEAPGAPRPLAMPYQDILVGDLLGAIDDHAIEPLMHHPAGQSVAYVRSSRPVAAVFAGLVEEAERTLQRLARGA